MSTDEQIRRYKLQLEGLESWPPGDVRQMMEKWVKRQIAKLQKN
jgi:hypothetical protein